MLGVETQKHSQAKHLLKKIMLECQEDFPDLKFLSSLWLMLQSDGEY